MVFSMQFRAVFYVSLLALMIMALFYRKLAYKNRLWRSQQAIFICRLAVYFILEMSIA